MYLEFWSQNISSYSRLFLVTIVIFLISCVINRYFLQEQVWGIPIDASFMLCAVRPSHFLFDLNVKFELSQVYQSCFDLHVFILTHR